MWWWLLGAGVLFSWLVATFVRVNARVLENRSPKEIDDETLRKELLKWEIVMLNRYGSVRHVKLFSNRVRFIWALGSESNKQDQRESRQDVCPPQGGHKPEERGMLGERNCSCATRVTKGDANWAQAELSKVVALCALVELGVLSVEANFAGKGGVAILKRVVERAGEVVSKESPEGRAPAIKEIVDSLCECDWIRFVGIAKNVKFPRAGRAHWDTLP